MKLKILSAATATNSAPSGNSAGFPLRRGAAGQAQGEGLADDVDSAVLQVASTAGSGTMTVTLKLWGYSSVTGGWHPFGTHATDATRGIINEGNAIGEVATDLLRHAEMVAGLTAFERIYLEVTAIGGTATAVSAWLVARG